MDFKTNLDSLPTIDHLSGLNVLDDGKVIHHIPAAPGKLGSLRVYNALAQQFDGKLDRTLICTPKVGHLNQQIKVQIFMGKHYSTEFKLQVIQQVLTHQMGIREVAHYFSIPSHSSIVMWLQRVEKCGINGLIRQPNRKHNMAKSQFDGSEKVKNPTDIKALLKRIEYLEAENACLKKLKELDEKKHRRKKETSSMP